MIHEFTPLRFALCMMIFCHHAYQYTGGGAPAVATFFILSGFCLSLGYRDRILSNTFNFFNYIKVRFVKCYVIHWITLVACILISLYLGNLVIDKKMLLANALLLQSWIPVRSFYFSYNAIAWYLSTALFTYICFPMFISFLGKIAYRWHLIMFVIMLLCYGIIVYVMPSEKYHEMFYIHPISRCVDFVMGLYLAEWYRRIDIERVKNKGWLFDMGILVSFVLLNVLGVYIHGNIKCVGAIFWFPSCLLILCISLAAKTKSILSRLLSLSIIQKATACSFSLMMWSLCVVHLFHGIYVENDVLGKMSMMLCAYLVALISHYVIEKKFMTWIICKVQQV